MSRQLNEVKRILDRKSLPLGSANMECVKAATAMYLTKLCWTQ